MFDWLYQLNTPFVALAVVGVTAGVAIGGFEIARRSFLGRFKYHDGINDAISGALGALGIFYGVVVGLIAIDVWQRHNHAEDLVSREAAAVQTLYLSVRPESGIGRSSVPDQVDNVIAFNDDDLLELRKPTTQLVSEYLREVICVAWDQQQVGAPVKSDWSKLRKIRAKLQSFEPEHEGQKVRYAAAIQALNNLSELRRLRGDATDDQLTWVMWMIILLGAMMSICVVYLFRLEDVRLHRLMVGLFSGFLGFVLLLIVLNNRPFFGKASLQPESYIEVSWIIKKPATLQSDLTWSDQARLDRKTACTMLGHQ